MLSCRQQKCLNLLSALYKYGFSRQHILRIPNVSIIENEGVLNYFRPSMNVYCHVNLYSRDAKVTSSSAAEQQSQEIQLKKKSLEGGVTINDLVLGNGASAKSGKTVTVYYSGRLKGTNELFDAMTKGSGLTFRLGRGEVIDGWDIGLVGMKVGGKRAVTCPPNMAYGARGFPPKIPPNSTLIFEVELKAVK